MKILPFAIAATLAAGSASATTLMFTSNVVGLTTTNYHTTLTLPEFNPVLGTLQSINVTLFGNLKGTAKAESLDASPSVIVTDLASTLTLTRPGGGVIVVTTPIATNTFNATAFDGTTDFGGTSGVTYQDVTATNSNFAVLTTPADFALFEGTGSIVTPLSAAGTSSATGPGNLISSFSTTAGGYATVTYTYTNGVPEPMSWALMMVGFGLAGASMRRRGRVAA